MKPASFSVKLDTVGRLISYSDPEGELKFVFDGSGRGDHPVVEISRTPADHKYDVIDVDKISPERLSFALNQVKQFLESLEMKEFYPHPNQRFVIEGE